MKKRILSAITACICMASSVLSMTGYADTFMEHPNCDDLLIIAHDPTLSNVLLIHTDGTEMTEDMVSNFEGYSSFPTWVDYAYNSTYMIYRDGEMIPGDGTLPDADQDGEPDSDNNYCVTLAEGYTDKASLQKFAKQIMLTYDFVEEVYLLNDRTITKCSNDFSFKVELLDGVQNLDISMLPELGEDFEIESYTSNEVEYYSVQFIGEEDGNPLFETDSERPSEASYTVYQRWIALGEELLANHSDILSSVTLKCTESQTLDIFMPFFEVEPVWQTAGDHNADGETNSNDAAALLVQAAEDGAAEASAETVSPDSDVNLDGVADPSDAAYILQYSALKGAGMDPDWVEILKK